MKALQIIGIGFVCAAGCFAALLLSLAPHEAQAGPLARNEVAPSTQAGVAFQFMVARTLDGSAHLEELLAYVESAFLSLQPNVGAAVLRPGMDTIVELVDGDGANSGHLKIFENLPAQQETYEIVFTGHNPIGIVLDDEEMADTTLSAALIYINGSIHAFNVCVQMEAHHTVELFYAVAQAGSMQVGAIMDFRATGAQWRPVTLVVSGDIGNPTWTTSLEQWQSRPNTSFVEHVFDELLVPLQTIRGACNIR